jgi:hypothetical protein
MLQFLYTSDYESPLGDDGTYEMRSRLILHAELYAMADKYGIDTLANQSKVLYLACTSTSWDPQPFFDSISPIYQLTPDTNRGLRDVAVSCARSHRRALSHEASIREMWRTVCDNVPEFAFDVLDSFMKAPLLGRCHKCGPGQVLQALQLSCLRCGKGGASEIREVLRE